MFEVAGKKAASNDYDYAADLLGQCVNGDPSNPNYVRAYIENLQKKYGNNKRRGPAVPVQGTRFASGMLKRRSAKAYGIR